MSAMNDLPKRKRNRLSGDLYHLPGAYFITICVHNKTNLFWSRAKLSDQQQAGLTALGGIVEEQMHLTIAGYAPMVSLEKYVIMPNHVHMLISLKQCPEHRCPDIRYVVRLYKRNVSLRSGSTIWQKGFHDHIVRNEEEYRMIWKYIDENPMRWELDRYYIHEDGWTLEPGR